MYPLDEIHKKKYKELKPLITGGKAYSEGKKDVKKLQNSFYARSE